MYCGTSNTRDELMNNLSFSAQVYESTRPISPVSWDGPYSRVHMYIPQGDVEHDPNHVVVGGRHVIEGIG